MSCKPKFLSRLKNYLETSTWSLIRSRIQTVDLHKCIVNAPHCVELAWKFPLSTWRYRVLTVWDRSRLNKATFVPDAIHTGRLQQNIDIMIQ